MTKKLFFSSFLLFASALNADVSSNIDNLTLTNISFNMDEDGNLNPNIFIPYYYGDTKQFYSSVAYSASNFTEATVLESFSDSKNAVVSNSKDFTFNYITYNTTFFGLQTSFGIESTFSKINNNEFGYIHDSDNIFDNGTDYYLSFDNDIELNIKRHALRADVVIPMGEYFSSRFFVSVSPLMSIDVTQSTLFKPLISETGTSSSSTDQDISYTLRYDGLIKTGTFVNIALEAYYDAQPLKYNIAQLAQKDGKFLFETNEIDTLETTTRFVGKLLFDMEVLGGLNPSIGYGIETLKTKDNISGNTVSKDKTIITFGVEKLF